VKNTPAPLCGTAPFWVAIFAHRLLIARENHRRRGKIKLAQRLLYSFHKAAHQTIICKKIAG
jgi:hypothetical protein